MANTTSILKTSLIGIGIIAIIGGAYKFGECRQNTKIKKNVEWNNGTKFSINPMLNDGSIPSNPSCFAKQAARDLTTTAQEQRFILIDVLNDGSLVQKVFKETTDVTEVKKLQLDLTKGDALLKEIAPLISGGIMEIKPEKGTVPFHHLRDFNGDIIYEKPDKPGEKPKPVQVRSPLSIKVNKNAVISFVLVDTNLEFNESGEIDLTNAPTNFHKSPFTDLSIGKDNKKIKIVTLKFDQNWTLGKDFGKTQPPIACQYGFNLNVVSRHVVDPDGILGNEDDYEVETPIIIDPIIENDGTGN